MGFPTNDPGNYLAFGVQSAKDVAASTFYFLKHLDGSGFEVNNEIVSEKEGGDGQETGLRYKTQVNADGAAIVNSRPGVAGRLLAWVLGADAASSVASGFGYHVQTPAASLPYVTVEQRFVDEIERFSNGQFTSLTIEGEAGRPLKMTANFISGGSIFQRDVASTLTPTRESARPHFFPGASVTFDGAGSYAKHITKFKVEITRSVDDGIYTNGLTREDVVPLAFDVNVDATVRYSSRDFYQKVMYGSGSQVPIDLSTGAMQIVSRSGAAGGANAGSNLLQLDVTLLQYADAKVNKLDPDGKTTYLDITAMSIKGATHAVIGQTYNVGEEPAFI